MKDNKSEAEVDCERNWKVVLLCVILVRGTSIFVHMHAWSCLYMCVERGLGCYPQEHMLSASFETECLIGLELTSWDTLAGHQAPRIQWSPPPQHWNYRHVPLYLAF